MTFAVTRAKVVLVGAACLGKAAFFGGVIRRDGMSTEVKCCYT